eukprot:8106266-Ditylum_brightwellii.AAC.1
MERSKILQLPDHMKSRRDFGHDIFNALIGMLEADELGVNQGSLSNLSSLLSSIHMAIQCLYSKPEQAQLPARFQLSIQFSDNHDRTRFSQECLPELQSIIASAKMRLEENNKAVQLSQQASCDTSEQNTPRKSMLQAYSSFCSTN